MSLQVKIYPGRPCYYIRGTIRVGSRTSGPVFETTGIRIAGSKSRQKAEEVCFRRYEEIREELLNGPRIVEVSWIEAAVEYCAWRKAKREAENPDLLGTIDPEAGYALRFTEYLESVGAAHLPLSRIGIKHIEGYLLFHLQGRKPLYLRKCESSIVAIMNHAKRHGLCAPGLIVPKATLPRAEVFSPVNKHFDDETVALFVDCAPPHARLFFAAVFTLGLRAGELLYAKRTPMLHAEAGKSGICLVPGREMIFLANTKPGLAVERAIPPDLAEAFRRALDARTDKFDALFLTHTKRPYKRSGNNSGFRFRVAWCATRGRVGAELEQRAAAARMAGNDERARYYLEEADKVRRSTGHWGRHTMISNAVMKGLSDRMIMKMSGHVQPQMISRYTHLRDGSIRDAAQQVVPNLSLEQMLNGKSRCATAKARGAKRSDS
jgi:integrase